MILQRNRDIGSQQVSWLDVHLYVAPRLAQVSFPAPGTPSWCSLPDDDPRKLAALLDAAQHWALRIELDQLRQAEASRDVATAADWPAVARNVARGRGSAYIARRAS